MDIRMAGLSGCSGTAPKTIKEINIERVMENVRIALFKTTHETLKGEKVLELEGISFRPVIKPRNISAQCGMGLEFNLNDLDKVIKISREHELDIVGIYVFSCGTWKRCDSKLQSK